MPPLDERFVDPTPKRSAPAFELMPPHVTTFDDPFRARLVVARPADLPAEVRELYGRLDRKSVV